MLAIRVRFIGGDMAKPARLCADNGRDKMYVAYDYIDIDAQAKKLVQDFVAKFHNRARGVSLQPISYNQVDYYGLL